MRGAIAVSLLSLAGCASAASAGGAAEVSEADEIAAVLDDWHDAATRADEDRYLGHFAADGVFLGTDPGERWTVAEFEEYVRAHFPRGGWTYLPHDRFVVIDDGGRVAWFDEQLTHGSYGELRGTGALRKYGSDWRIESYSLTFTIPNDAAQDVVRAVSEWRATQGE